MFVYKHMIAYLNYSLYGLEYIAYIYIYIYVERERERETKHEKLYFSDNAVLLFLYYDFYIYFTFTTLKRQFV